MRDRIPIPGFLVELEDGRRLLWDMGTDEAALALPGVFDEGFPPPEMGPEDLLGARLEAAGCGLDGVDMLGLSHAGGLRHLSGREVIVHADELAYAMGEPDIGCYRRDDDAGPGVSVRFCSVDGDEEVLPGVTVLATPGHSPGHLSLMVRLASGRSVLVASDAGDLRENFDREVPPGILLAGRERALESIRRLCALAEETGALLIPGHDPVAWAALPAELS
jgi:N-acyl homoserine lactone hydrolase